MSAVAVIEPDDQPSLDELAATINREHNLVIEGLASAVTHAIRAGDALLAAKGLVEPGQWTDWLTANFPKEQSTAQSYMRFAFYRTLVADAESVKSAALIVRGLPSLALGHNGSASARRRVSPQEVASLRESGRPTKEIADLLGVSTTTIYYHTKSPKERQAALKTAMERERRKRNEIKAAKSALERQRLNAAIKKASGDISHCYSDVRRLLQRLDRMGARPAYAACEALEREIVKLLKSPSP